MLALPEKIVFAVVALVSFYLSWRTFSRMWHVIQRGQDKLYWDNPVQRIGNAIWIALTQKTVFRQRPLISFMHALVAWAFILYMLVNIGDVLTGYIPNFHFLGKDGLGNWYRMFVDVFTVLALISVVVFLVRRFLFNSQRLIIRDNILLAEKARSGMRSDSLLVGLFILFHIGFRFLGESFTIAANSVDSWQPFASAVAGLWQGFTPETLTVMIHVCWWIALGLILAFIPYFPSSKHIHLMMGPFNFASRPKRNAYGTLSKLDFEDDDVEQFGVAALEQLDKTQLVDAYACIMCNRCQDACPAYVTGKELSPAAIEVNKRYLIKERLSNLVGDQESGITLVDMVLSESALWACTSCAACVDVCPVGNEPMQDILNARRDRVLMESAFPKELQGAFNGMERNQNPWNINGDRLAWSKEDESLKVPTIEENPDFDVLYWVGCAGAFDQKGQVIARSFGKILNHAGVNFAVLGNQESCTGDSARRAGNEYLFSMMAEANVETLNKANVKKIVTTCPHCLHTLKNEYPQFGGNYEVVHHTEFIEQLKQEQKLHFKSDIPDKKLTLHDPCYLGRHNGVFDAPRENIKSLNTDFIELPRSRETSFCCGAGGGQMWKEEEAGSGAVRQNRMQEIHDSGAELVCTACPFCLTMMRDAANEMEVNVVAKDIAEVLAEQLDE